MLTGLHNHLRQLRESNYRCGRWPAAVKVLRGLVRPLPVSVRML
jgi:hypothetical protein